MNAKEIFLYIFNNFKEFGNFRLDVAINIFAVKTKIRKAYLLETPLDVGEHIHRLKEFLRHIGLDIHHGRMITLPENTPPPNQLIDDEFLERILGFPCSFPDISVENAVGVTASAIYGGVDRGFYFYMCKENFPNADESAKILCLKLEREFKKYEIDIKFYTNTTLQLSDPYMIYVVLKGHIYDIPGWNYEKEVEEVLGNFMGSVEPRIVDFYIKPENKYYLASIIVALIEEFMPFIFPEYFPYTDKDILYINELSEDILLKIMSNTSSDRRREFQRITNIIYRAVLKFTQYKGIVMEDDDNFFALERELEELWL